MVNTLVKVLQTLWNGNYVGYEGYIVQFFNNLFSWEPTKAAVALQMLPKSWLKENMVLVNPNIIRSFRRKLNNVLEPIAKSGKVTTLQLLKLDDFFTTINNENLSNINDYKTLFEQWHSFFLNQLQELAKNGFASTPNRLQELTKAWISKFLKDLASDVRREGIQVSWAIAMTGEILKIDDNIEIIQIIGSSWLDKVLYNRKKKIAIFKLLKKSTKLYEFYNVPRVAIEFVEAFRGKEMWDGFGFKYSLHPEHWIRRDMDKYYSKNINRIEFHSKLRANGRR